VRRYGGASHGGVAFADATDATAERVALYQARSVRMNAHRGTPLLSASEKVFRRKFVHPIPSVLQGAA
jgi:hypothetical protein